jgi:hypothetical protein
MVRVWNRKRRERALEARLRALAPDEYQAVRAYLSINARDEAFIREFLRPGSRGRQDA